MTSDFKDTIEFCGKNYKKELTKIVVIDLLLLGVTAFLYLYLKSLILSLVSLCLLAIIDFLFILSYRNYKARLIKQRDEEFIEMISCFEIFINNHLTVYQCFKMLIPYGSSWMSEQLTTLIECIDNDKSVKPFVDFARKFKAPIAENVMLSIYQMVDQGESGEQLNQFTIFFSQLSKSHQLALIDKKERSLSVVDSFPLIGTAGITVLIIISILFVLGDFINVI